MKKTVFFAIFALYALLLAGCQSNAPEIIPESQTPGATETIAPEPTATPVPTEKPTKTPTPTPGPSASKLKGYMNLVKNYNFEGYANPEVVDEPMKHAEELIASGTATQEDYDMALQAIKDAMGMLHDGSGYPAPEMLKKITEYPDAFTFFDGTPVNLPEDWAARKEELLNLYQYYMYG
ncbi:MAG: hypothetical protein J6K15_12530, partial [Lachnospiraceae bacterium]|nr:hypothetical protein [Lachnospiraceae bacterium]